MYKSFKIIIGHREDLNRYLLQSQSRKIYFHWNYIKNHYETRVDVGYDKSIHAIIKFVSGLWRLYLHIDRHVGASLHKVLKDKSEINKFGKKFEYGLWKGIPIE